MDPSGTHVLRSSDESFTSNSLWFHLRLDVIVNPQDDVVLNVYRSDLTTEDVDAPTWVAIPGMDAFVDDANGIIIGTIPPVTGGLYCVVGHYNNGNAGRVSLVDHVEIARQTSP